MESPARGSLAAAAKRGGTLVYCVESSPSGFGPARWWNGLSWHGTLAVFERLLTITSGGGLMPELLAAMPAVAQGGRLY
jgi:hypothetical protein